MTNEISNAVVSTLNDAFGGETKIYTEKVRQGFKTPCLFIERGNLSETMIRSNRFIRYFPFNITYFPSKEEIPVLSNFEMDKAVEKLFFSLSRIEIKDGSIFNGYSMKALNKGDFIEFSVSYKAIVTKVSDENKELMTQIEYNKGSE